MGKIKNPAERTDLLNATVVAFDAEQRRVFEQLLKLAPPGTRVSWTTERNGQEYRHYGRITGMLEVGRFRVQNEATGKLSAQYFGEFGNMRVEG